MAIRKLAPRNPVRSAKNVYSQTLGQSPITPGRTAVKTGTKTAMKIFKKYRRGARRRRRLVPGVP